MSRWRWGRSKQDECVGECAHCIQNARRPSDAGSGAPARADAREEESWTARRPLQSVVRRSDLKEAEELLDFESVPEHENPGIRV